MQEIHKSLTQKSKSYKKWHKFSGHETYHWLILVVLVIFAGMVIDNKADFLFGDAAPQNAGPQYGQSLGEQIPDLTKEMLDLAHKLRKAAPEERDAVLAELMAVAEERKALVGQAIKENPRAAVNSALNNQLRAQMPQEVRDMIEERKTIRGTFEWVVGENLDTHEMVNEYSVMERGTGKKYNVHLPKDELPIATTDDEVSLQGVVAGDNLAATSGDLQVTSEAGVTATTQKKVAVILFNFTNNKNQTISQDNVRLRYFTGANSTNNFYKENSFGQVELVGKLRADGDVFGWYTIPDDDSGCDRSGWASKAESMAQANGFSLSGYDFVSYIHPKASSCGAYLGWGTIGGTPGRTWIPDPREWVIPHELGHNMGAYHAVTWSCTENGVKVPISNNCTIQDEYGDDTTVMANQNMFHHTNYVKGKSNYHFDWLQASNTYTVDKNLQPDNVYTVAPIETPSSGIQSLRIPRTEASGKTAAEFYYIEFKQPIGFDSQNRSGSASMNSSSYNGVLIRLARDYSSTERTKLLDMTPGTGFADSALTIGKTFSDPNTGMNVSVLSVAPEGARVRVWFGTAPAVCTRANPTVTISPTSATTDAGGTLSYTVKVVNRDSSVCSGSTFSVTPTLQSGFLQSPSSFTTGTIAPGGTASQVINVTSADTVADGNYNFTQRAVSVGTNYVGSATATFVVAPPIIADIEAPQVSITSPANGSTVTGQIALTANASDNVGVTQVVFRVDGTAIGNPDTTAPYSVLWDSSSVPNGPHNIVADARDASGNTSNASVTVTTSNTQTGDTTVPQATIQNPANNAKLSNGQNNVDVSATDNVRVTKIDILLDGNVIGTCTGAQQTLTCSARFLGNKEASGAHFILVRAYDAAGNVGTAQVSVTK